jgi:hypothetical protein
MHREHAEGALVHPIAGLAGYESLQGLDAKTELAKRKRAADSRGRSRDGES